MTLLVKGSAPLKLAEFKVMDADRFVYVRRRLAQQGLQIRDTPLGAKKAISTSASGLKLTLGSVRTAWFLVERQASVHALGNLKLLMMAQTSLC